MTCWSPATDPSARTSPRTSAGSPRCGASRALTPADMTAIEQAIRNTLKTAFQPSNAMLPPAVRHMQFKTFRSPPGGLDAIAVLLNTSDRGGEASSAARLFLAGDDHFAYAAGKDFVIGAFDRMFARALDELNLRTFVYSFDIVTRLAGYVITRTTIRYTVTLGSVRLELESGRMLLTMDGSARTPSVLPNFAFRMTQALTLQLSGAEAELASAGDVTLTVTTGGIAGWIVNLFKGSAVSAVRSIRDRAIARAQPSVRAMLNAKFPVPSSKTQVLKLKTGNWSLFHDLNLKKFRPELPRHEQAIAGRIVGNAVHYVGGLGLSRRQKSVELDPSRHRSGFRSDAGNAVCRPHVGENLSLHILELVQVPDRHTAVLHLNS